MHFKVEKHNSNFLHPYYYALKITFLQDPRFYFDFLSYITFKNYIIFKFSSLIPILTVEKIKNRLPAVE